MLKYAAFGIGVIQYQVTNYKYQPKLRGKINETLCSYRCRPGTCSDRLQPKTGCSCCRSGCCTSSCCVCSCRRVCSCCRSGRCSCCCASSGQEVNLLLASEKAGLGRLFSFFSSCFRCQAISRQENPSSCVATPTQPSSQFSTPHNA